MGDRPACLDDLPGLGGHLGHRMSRDVKVKALADERAMETSRPTQIARMADADIRPALRQHPNADDPATRSSPTFRVAVHYSRAGWKWRGGCP